MAYLKANTTLAEYDARRCCNFRGRVFKSRRKKG
ncbi:MAG: hypothetical protein QOG67_1995 [Verrucomicrobiota bacterium]|jgi:hypothetical protein